MFLTYSYNRKNLLNYRSFTKPYPCNIDSFKTTGLWSRPGTSETKMRPEIFKTEMPRPVFSSENESFSILPNKPNHKFCYLTTGTFFSFCNKVCQVCITFIMHQRMFFITTVKLILLALLIAVAVILFTLLSSFTRQCIYRNGARAEDKVVCLRVLFKARSL